VVGAFPVFHDSSPRAPAAMPASFGKAVNAPAASLMPARASGSMWLRAFDLNNTGMPCGVASPSSWTLFMNLAASAGVRRVLAVMPVSGSPHTAKSGLVTVLRKIKRCIFYVLM
jgi:hypothetical protein